MSLALLSETEKVWLLAQVLLGKMANPWAQLFLLVLLILPPALLLIGLAWAVQGRRAGGMLVIAVIVFTLALTGAVSGYAGGVSRVGVVGNLVPAVLGLLGGVVIYLFGVDLSKGLIGSFATASLVTGFFLGYALGGEQRAGIEQQVDRKAFCRDVFSTNGIYGKTESLAVLSQDFKEPCLKAFGLK